MGHSRDKRVTIRDVARASGYSSTTVSIILNDAPSARYYLKSTQAKIERAAKKLGYRPNLFARSLRSNRSHTVGLMIFDVTDPYCTLILRGIQDALYQASYMSILTHVQNERVRFERYLEMLLEWRVEGLLVLANWMFMDVNLLAHLEKNLTPTVMIGRELKTGSVSSVIVNNKAGGTLALQHLYSLGHRKIAVIRGPKQLSDSAARWKGIRAFARQMNLHLDPDLIRDLPQLRDPMSGFKAAYQCTCGLIKGGQSFSAVVAFDDMTALGTMRAPATCGIRVPEQCSVVGFDDVELAALCTPPLTTIRQPMEVMGSRAVDILLEAITALRERKPFAASHHEEMPDLIVRQSTAAFS